MVQLSLIPALEAARTQNLLSATSNARSQSMVPENRPTAAQISYLKKLTNIRTDAQLARFVIRKLDLESQASLTRHDFAKVIDREVSEKRWAA